MKIVKIPKRLNVILKLNEKESFIASDRLTFDTCEISLKNHISNLYMKKEGFKPYKMGEGLVTKILDFNANDSLSIKSFIDYGDGSGSYSYDKTYNSIYDLFTVYEIYNDFCFITTYLDNVKNEIVFVKNILELNDLEEATIKEIDSFVISFISKKGFQITKDNKIIEPDNLSSFFMNNDVHANDKFVNKMIELIYNNFSGEVGFNDIYKDYMHFISSIPRDLSMYNIFKYIYFIGQIEYYLLAENLIKNESHGKLKKLNPVYTGKAIPNPSEVLTLSKVSLDILKNANSIGNSKFEKILTDMEKHSNIGANGIQLIKEVFDIYYNINKYNTPFHLVLYERVFENTYTIINTFKISVKTLLDRCIRASFYENCDPQDFFRTIIDYIAMSKQLRLPIEDKLPKDIFRMHDLLQGQIIYIRNSYIEKQFKTVKDENEKLLAFLPSNENLTIISPQTPNDLISEGLRMNHCVGSYIDRYASGSSKIFFIRFTSSIDTPYVTVELNNRNELIQVKAHSNRKPDKFVFDYLNEWFKQIGGNQIVK